MKTTLSISKTKSSSFEAKERTAKQNEQLQ